jgi:acyl-CoA dehydrogenase
VTGVRGLDGPSEGGVAAASAAAAAAADDVDRAARFPKEAMEALRAEGMLATLVPADKGGAGASLAEVSAAVTTLAHACGSAAMVYAMHQIQVACLVRHGGSRLLDDYLRNVARRQLLLASATTEAGIGGDIRSSGCAVERQGTRVRLCKQASVISYGEEADAVLATARRDADSPPSDQVLVLCRPPALSLRKTGGWDTLGLRGTRSLGFELRTEDEPGVVLSQAFADISARTMLPVSHVLWSSVWLGLADAAVDRARRFVQAEARRRPGTTPPQGLRLAELVALHQQMRALVETAAARFDAISDDEEALNGLGLPISMNSLKVSCSKLVVEIIGAALAVCGISAYREDSPFSMGRLLRDAYGAAVMVGNDRINASTAQLLLAHREG